MPGLTKTCAFASILVVVPAALAASNSGTVPGTWRKLRPAPFACHNKPRACGRASS